MSRSSTKPALAPTEPSLGGRKDAASITADWNTLQDPIEGVRVREVKNVLKSNGDVLCEIFRREWLPEEGVVDQVFQSVINPGNVSAWHVHRHTTDRLFVSQGVLRIVLYDARADSPSYQRVVEYRFGAVRPALLIIPPGVWHGVQNISNIPALLLNLVDSAYCYDDPDHWRLPPDTEKIPYRFER
jgi:dTDP-4-dehydrorhamnose 3,5-epimerase